MNCFYFYLLLVHFHIFSLAHVTTIYNLLKFYLKSLSNCAFAMCCPIAERSASWDRSDPGMESQADSHEVNWEQIRVQTRLKVIQSLHFSPLFLMFTSSPGNIARGRVGVVEKMIQWGIFKVSPKTCIVIHLCRFQDIFCMKFNNFYFYFHQLFGAAPVCTF